MRKLSLGTLLTAALAVPVVLYAACQSAPETAAAARDPRWAQRIELPGLPNFHKVAEGLYRGAQPTPEGFRELRRLGVRTVVNLRAMHSDEDEIREAGEADGLRRERIHFNTWHAEHEDVVRFLRIVTDREKQPVFFHCQHGADRTGTMCAVYRVVVQGWSKEDALREMREGGYGFHPIWQNLVDYFNNLDVERLKKEAGLK